ncbi:helix-turn-helix domain-containing protein [Pasteurella multocida]
MLKNIHHLAQTEQQHLAKALNMEGCTFRLILISDFALLTLIQEQRICSELYYLFLHTQFELLPLKKRPSDILPIFCHYVHKSCARLNKEYVEPNKKLIQHLLTQTWQGNVKELIHVAELYAIGLLAEQTPMSNPLALKTEHIKPLDEQINEYEKQIIEDALIFYQGRINDVATYLNIPRKKLYLRMKKHHIDKKHYKC